MQGFLSDEVALGWVIDLSQRARYVSAHFELPNWSDPTASELTDSGYARCPTTWSVLSNRTIGNAVVLGFSVNLDTTVLALGFHTELTNASMLAYATTPKGDPLRPQNTILVQPGLLQFFIGEVVLGIG
jgi:hypothetical protein